MEEGPSEEDRKHPTRDRLIVIVVAAALGTGVIAASTNVDKTSINLAAQSLISMAAFLAAASAVLTSIYLGQVLRDVPGIVGKLQPSFTDMLTQSIQKLSPEDLAEFQEVKTPDEFKAALLLVGILAMKKSMQDWKEAISGFMSGAKEIRRQGAHALYLLVVSAIVSVLVILTGLPFLLGLSISLIILAVWSIVDSWSEAEETIKATLWISSFFLGLLKDSEKKGPSSH